jgi:hypothetical protein
MRAWAVSHPAEFEWIFASPVSGTQHQPDSARHQAGLRFENVFIDMIVEVWNTRPFPVPELDALPQGLPEQLHAYSRLIDRRLPPEAVHQMDFVLTDMQPLYEQCLSELSGMLGLAPEP